MTSMKAKAIELLQDIPDDKVPPVIEVLKGLRLLYIQGEEPVTRGPENPNAMGIFHKYANPGLIPVEKEAWGEAVKEKHAAN